MSSRHRSPGDGYNGHRRGNRDRNRDRDQDRERDRRIRNSSGDHDKRKRPREQNTEPIDSRAEARQSDGDWAEYAEILDIPIIEGLNQQNQVGIHKDNVRTVVASIVNKVLKVKTCPQNVQLVDTATELVWDETRPINTIDDVRVTGSSAEGGRWFVCERAIWVPMERTSATSAMALPPLGSKMTVRAFYTGDAEVAGWSSERRKCQWQAIDFFCTPPLSPTH